MAEFDGRSYQDRFDALADEGMDVHGEATLIRSLRPGSVLDAGCGTGRVAIELARHGIDVIGVDANASMISEAMRRAPDVPWVQADLATLALDRLFDVVVLAGNVPLFCPVATRTALVTRCADHVVVGGTMIAGFELERGYELIDYDTACETAGLTLKDRWSTWDGQPFANDSQYAVSVHRN